MNEPRHPNQNPVNPSPVAVPWSADNSGQNMPTPPAPVVRPHPQAVPVQPMPLANAPAPVRPVAQPIGAPVQPTFQAPIHQQQPSTYQPHQPVPMTPQNYMAQGQPAQLSAPQQAQPQQAYASHNAATLNPATSHTTGQEAPSHAQIQSQAQYGQAYQPQTHQAAHPSPMHDLRASINNRPAAIETVAAAPKSFFAKLLKRSPKVDMPSAGIHPPSTPQLEMPPQFQGQFQSSVPDAPKHMMTAMQDPQVPYVSLENSVETNTAISSVSTSLFNKNFVLGAVTGIVIGAFVLPMVLNMFISKPEPQLQALSQSEAMVVDSMADDAVIDNEGQTFLDAAIASEDP